METGNEVGLRYRHSEISYITVTVSKGGGHGPHSYAYVIHRDCVTFLCIFL